MIVNNDRRFKIVDPLYEPVDMALDNELCRILAPLYFDLMTTFELRHAQGVVQSGSLYEIYHGATHTRRAHAIGCWCVAWYALNDIRVVTNIGEEDITIKLRDWLQMPSINLLREFMVSALLHDIGHPPFSHALEFSPSLGIDHVQITGSLITGKPDNEGIHWHKSLILKFGQFRMRDYQPELPYKNEWEKRKRLLKTVYEVLVDANIDTDIVRYITTGILPDDGGNFKKFLSGDSMETIELQRRFEAVYALHQLADSQVDIDRIDHFLRDSYYTGIRFANYRIRPFLQNLEIVTRGANKYRTINDGLKDKQKDRPVFVLVKKAGLQHVHYLNAVRELIYDAALWLPENLRLIGALNQGVRAMVSLQKSIKFLLPTLTDETLLQFFRHKRFISTPVEGLGRVLNGEIPSKFYKCYSWKPKETDKAFSRINELYINAEDTNFVSPLEPQILIFTNFLESLKEEQKGNKDNTESILIDGDFIPLREMENESSLFDWFDAGDNSRKRTVLIWVADEQCLYNVLGLDSSELEEIQQ